MSRKRPTGVQERFNRLNRELSQHPAEVATRRAAAMAVGRVLLDKKIRGALRSSHVSHRDLVLTPLLPVINHFPKQWMSELAANGKSAASMKLAAGAPVPERVYGVQDFMQALRNLPGLDAETAFSEVHVPLLGVSVERYAGWRYGVALQIGDAELPAYPSGYIIQGEKDALMPIRRTSNPLARRPIPDHKVQIAEAYSEKYGKEDLVKTFEDSLEALGMLASGTLVEFSGIKPVFEEL